MLDTLFQEIFEGSRDAIFLADEGARFVEVNRAACDLTGYSRAELLSMSFTDLCAEADLSAFRDYFDSIISVDVAVSELLITCKCGSRVPVELSGRKLILGGRPFVHAAARDITGRKRVEERLKERERQLSTAQKIARLGSWEWDILANKVSWSDELHRIYGLSPENFGANHEAFLDRVHPFDREFVQDVIANALQGYQPFDIYHRIIRPDKTVRTIQALGEVIVDDGRAIKMVGTAQDVTERQSVEELLRESEDRYRDLVEHSHDLICTHDLTGRILSVNQAAVKAIGYDQATLLTKNIRDGLLPEFQSRFDRYIAGIQEKGFARGVMAVRTGTGERRIWEYNNTLRTEGVDSPVVRGMAHDITERKRAEESLRRAEEKYRSIFENAVEGIFQSTPDGRFISVNPAMARMYGFTSPEEMIRERTDIERQHYVDPQTRATFRRLLEENDVVEGLEAEAYARNGTKFWTSENVRAVRDPRGAVLYYEGFVKDITERKRAEAALQLREEYFRSLIEHSRDIITLLDERGVRRYVSPSVERVLGYKPEELIGQSVFDLWHAEDSYNLVRLFKHKVKDPGYCESVEIRCRHKDGSWRILEATAVNLLHDPVVSAIVVNSRDITERKLAEDEIRRQKEILQKIFDHIPAMVAFIDSTGAVKIVNREWEHITGWSDEESCSHDMLTEFYPEPEYRRFVLDFINSSTGEWGDFKTRIRSGKVLDTMWANVKLMDGTSIGIGQDITERKRTEEAREQLLKDRKQLLSRLVTAQEEERRRIARELHDQLGQQITALMLGIKLLKDSGYCQPQAAEHLNRLQEYADQLGREVHNIAWELRPTALDDLGLQTALGNYLEKWSERSGKKVELHTSGLNGHRLSAQIETTLYRVIQEALTNVLKHARAATVSLILERRNNHVRAIIEDDGCGFDVEAVMSAPESERKLGLLGMRERLALVFGTLEIESTPGAGTTLFVRIPTPTLEIEETIQ